MDLRHTIRYLGVALLTLLGAWLAGSTLSPWPVAMPVEMPVALLVALLVPLACLLSVWSLRSRSAPIEQVSPTASAALPETLAANSTDLHLLVDHTDQIRVVSAALAAALTVEPAALLGRAFSELLQPADRQRWQSCATLLSTSDKASQLAMPFGRLRLLRARVELLAPEWSAQTGDRTLRATAAANMRTTLHPEVLYLDVTVSPATVQLADGAEVRGIVINARDISGVVVAERALTRLETRYSFLFQSCPDAILVIRAMDRLVLDFNTGFVRLFDVTRERGIGIALNQLDLWQMPDGLGQFLDGVNARTGLIEQPVQLVRGPHRQCIDARVSASFTEVDGELAVLLIFRDVTERRETEQALKDIEQKFALVFNAAPDAISITRLSDGVLIDVNDHLCEASGYAREELLGRNLMEVGVIEDQREALRALQMLQRYGSFRDIEVSLISKNGERVPTLASATQVEIGGECCVVTIAKDVRIVRRTEQALRISEARFRGAFEDAPLGMALIDGNLRLIEGNYWLAGMMGIELAQLPARKLADLLVPEERDGLEQALLQLLEQEHGHLHREQRLQRPDGELRHATLHAVVQQDSEGDPKFLIVQLADVTDIKRSQEQMERLAFYDPLTNLANRRLFMDRLEQTMQHATRSGRPAALFYLDLDQFKKINDELGHDVGDALLKVVAERLRTCVRREDTVGRPGGDEFNIVLHEVRDADAAAHVAEHVLTVLREGALIDGRQLSVTTSIGIAMIPDDGSDATLLVQRADQAMYRAKQQGRNTYRFYGDAVNARAVERLNFENALERALLRDELTLFYQPIYNLEDNSLYAVEALLRWQHPQRGLLQPALFLDVTEHSGLLRALDMWVLRKACRQLQALDQAGVHVPAVSVNIANRHISDPNLPRTIEQLLADAGLAASRLQIEITEGVLAREPESAQHWLEPLRKLGLTLTIDDFGGVTGSLTAISRLPIQRVKLDTTVIHRLTSSREAAIMVDTVVAVCAGLGRDVIAEGVETNEQRERLLRAGCKLAQGYLLGSPQTSSELLNSLRAASAPVLAVVSG